jgi:hypothetical protein
MKSNFTTEDGNDGTKYPETIPPILLHGKRKIAPTLKQSEDLNMLISWGFCISLAA